MHLKSISCFLGALISVGAFLAAASDTWLEDMELANSLGEDDCFFSGFPTDTPSAENANLYLSLEVYLLQDSKEASAGKDDQRKTPVSVDDKILPKVAGLPGMGDSKKSAKKIFREDHNPTSSAIGKKQRIRWTKAEDKELIRIVRKQQDALREDQKINWPNAAKKLLEKAGVNRTCKQLRERFDNHLDNVHKGPLPDAIKSQILELQEEMGCQWSAIAKIINKNRRSDKITPLCIKNFYYGFISRAKKEKGSVEQHHTL